MARGKASKISLLRRSDACSRFGSQPTGKYLIRKIWEIFGPTNEETVQPARCKMFRSTNSGDCSENTVIPAPTEPNQTCYKCANQRGTVGAV